MPGLAAGRSDGFLPGRAAGRSDGFLPGLADGLSDGLLPGLAAGLLSGLLPGFVDGLPEDGFDGVRSAGLISAFLVTFLLFLSSDLTEVVPALRPDVDDEERDTEDLPEVDDDCREEDEDLAFPRD